MVVFLGSLNENPLFFGLRPISLQGVGFYRRLSFLKSRAFLLV